MANHKSSLKRIRANQVKKTLNRYQAKSCRNAVRNLRGTKDKALAAESLPKVISMLDKLAKKSVIHKNKASNLKSKLTRLVSSL